jgi:hypothetical protein
LATGFLAEQARRYGYISTKKEENRKIICKTLIKAREPTWNVILPVSRDPKMNQTDLHKKFF